MFIAEMMKKEETNNGDGTENKMVVTTASFQVLEVRIVFTLPTF